MIKPRRSSCQCRVDEFERLRLARGYSIEYVAKRAKVSKKTVERLLKGERVDLHTIRKLSEQLGVSPSAIQAREPELQQDSGASRFNLRLAIDGSFTSQEQANEVARLGTDGVSRLRMLGATVQSHREALIHTTDGVAIPTDPDCFVLIGLAWQEGGSRRHRLVLIRADKYPAFIDAIVAFTFTPMALNAYGYALPNDVSSIRTVWDVVESQASSDLTTEDVRRFTVVPMPNAWRFISRDAGMAQVHTPEVLTACDRELADGLRYLDDEVLLRQSPPSRYSLAVIWLKWRVASSTFDATAIVDAVNYVPLVRSIRSLTLDVAAFSAYGRFVVYGSDRDISFWMDPRKAETLILNERSLAPNRVYVARVKFWDAANPFEHCDTSVSAASLM